MNHSNNSIKKDLLKNKCDDVLNSMRSRTPLAFKGYPSYASFQPPSDFESTDIHTFDRRNWIPIPTSTSLDRQNLKVKHHFVPEPDWVPPVQSAQQRVPRPRSRGVKLRSVEAIVNDTQRQKSLSAEERSNHSSAKTSPRQQKPVPPPPKSKVLDFLNEITAVSRTNSNPPSNKATPAGTTATTTTPINTTAITTTSGSSQNGISKKQPTTPIKKPADTTSTTNNSVTTATSHALKKTLSSSSSTVGTPRSSQSRQNGTEKISSLEKRTKSTSAKSKPIDVDFDILLTKQYLVNDLDDPAATRHLEDLTKINLVKKRPILRVRIVLKKPSNQKEISNKKNIKKKNLNDTQSHVTPNDAPYNLPTGTIPTEFIRNMKIPKKSKSDKTPAPTIITKSIKSNIMELEEGETISPSPSPRYQQNIATATALSSSSSSSSSSPTRNTSMTASTAATISSKSNKRHREHREKTSSSIDEPQRRSKIARKEVSSSSSKYANDNNEKEKEKYNNNSNGNTNTTSSIIKKERDEDKYHSSNGNTSTASIVSSSSSTVKKDKHSSSNSYDEDRRPSTSSKRSDYNISDESDRRKSKRDSSSRRDEELVSSSSSSSRHKSSQKSSTSSSRRRRQSRSRSPSRSHSPLRRSSSSSSNTRSNSIERSSRRHTPTSKELHKSTSVSSLTKEKVSSSSSNNNNNNGVPKSNTLSSTPAQPTTRGTTASTLTPISNSTLSSKSPVVKNEPSSTATANDTPVPSKVNKVKYPPATAENAETPDQYRIFTMMFQNLAKVYKRRGDAQEKEIMTILDHFQAVLNYIIAFHFIDKQGSNGTHWDTLHPFADALSNKIRTWTEKEKKDTTLLGLCLRMNALVHFYIFQLRGTAIRTTLTRLNNGTNLEEQKRKDYTKFVDKAFAKQELAQRAFGESEKLLSFEIIQRKFPATYQNVCQFGELGPGIVIGGEAGVSVAPMFPLTPYSKLNHAAIMAKCMLHEYVEREKLNYQLITKTEDFM